MTEKDIIREMLIDKIYSYATLILFLISVVCLVVIAVITKNFWTGLVIFIGLMLQLNSRSKSLDGDYISFFGLAVAGVVLVGAGAWKTQLIGGWLWTPIWLLAPLLVGMGGWTTMTIGRAGGSKVAEAFGLIGLAMGFVGGLFAVFGPLIWA